MFSNGTRHKVAVRSNGDQLQLTKHVWPRRNSRRVSLSSRSAAAAGDKTLCIGMESSGGPASYVELLSCLEVNRDAREIQSADPLEADLNSPPSTTTGSASTEPRRRRRR
jgi:hypothetical protein